MNYFNSIKTIAADSTIDWDYYRFCLTIIHAFCEVLSHFFCEKGWLLSHFMVFLLSTIHILTNTCKLPVMVVGDVNVLLAVNGVV